MASMMTTTATETATTSNTSAALDGSWGNIQMGSLNELTLMMNQAYADASDKSTVDSPKETHAIIMDATVVKRLEEENVALTTAVNFAWSKLLQIYTQDDTTTMGVQKVGQQHSFPLVTQWPAGASSASVMASMDEFVSAARKHIPLSELVRLNKGELPFNTVVAFDAACAGQQDDDVPLTLRVNQTNDGALHFKLRYNSTWMAEDDAEELIHKLIRILRFVSQQPTSPHEQAGAAAMSDAERQTVLYGWNATEEPFNRDECLHHSIEATAAEQPDKIILEYLDEKVAFRELNERANRLAHMIRNLAGPAIDANSDKAFVALYMNRSVHTIVAILAVLKSGCAYVPISVDNATERAKQILEDVQPHVIVTNETFVERLNGIAQEAPLIAAESVPDDLPTTNPKDVKRTASDLAYLLYTSGTTGKPKGCMIEHKNVQWLVHGQKPWTHGPDIKKTLFWAPYMFDISVLEIFCSLITGTTIVIASDALKADIGAVGDFLIEKEIDWAFFTPTVAKVLDHSKMNRLKRVHFGGEPSTNELLNSVRRFTNVYNITGPSETTVYTQVHKFEHGDPSTAVGKPMANCKLYVLDSNLQPVPVGCPGECCIGGAGVGRGYMKRPELTSEKFIDNPFEPGTRMYKSGDLCKWGKDGVMHIMGRIDTQVKIRGNRIELGEVEAALNAVEGVERAVVIDAKPKQGGNKFLAAYVVGTASSEFIVEQVGNVIPKYMIPSTFNSIPKIPLNFNGKLDRKALPEPNIGGSGRGAAASEMPRSKLEQTLCDIWTEVLQADNPIGINDNFFHIGGDSISCLQILYKIRRAGLGNFRARDFYKVPTISSLSQLIESSTGASEAVVGVVCEPDQSPLSGSFATLPIQDEFFKADMIHPHHFNQAFTIQLPKGHNVSSAKLKEAVSRLAKHHDILRCVFKHRQHVVSDKPTVEVVDMRMITCDGGMLSKLQSTLDIEKGPLWRVVLHSDDKLWLAFHHLVIDVVSWRILAEDLQTLLTGGSLGPKTCSYKQWIKYVKSYGKKNAKSQAPFWKRVLEAGDKVDAGEALLAQSVAAAGLSAPSKAQLVLDSDETSGLLRDAHKAYNTEMNDLLLAALGRALAQVTGSRVNKVSLEGIGRMGGEDDHVDVSRTVGWFTTMYPVRLDATDTCGDAIMATKDMLRSIPDKGLGFGALVQAGRVPDKVMPIIFNYLGQIGSSKSGCCDSNCSSDWAIDTEADNGLTISKQNRDSAACLEINAIVNMATSQLEMEITSYLEQSVTDAFESALGHELREVVAHTCSLDANQKAPSDYLVPGLTVDWLQGVQSRCEGNGEIEGIYLATSLQQAFISHAVSHPDDSAYCNQLTLKYKGKLDTEAYRQAWEYTVERYPTLRCGFDWVGPEALMVVYKEAQGIPFEVIDVRNKSSTVDDVRTADRQVKYDLAKPPLVRIKCLQLNDEEWSILFSSHHAVLDGWSMPILCGAVSDSYFEIVKSGVPTEVKDIDQGFFAGHDYRMQALPEAREFWKNVTLGAANDLSLMMNQAYADAPDKAYLDKPQETSVVMDADIVQRLKKNVCGNGVTLNAAVNFAWSKLLQIYSQDDTTISGLTMSGREMPVDGIERSVGMFINTLPLVVQWQSGMSSVDIMKHLTGFMAEMSSHSQMPLLDLIKQSGETPFNTIVVYENYPDAEAKDEAFQVGLAQEKLDVPLGLTALEAKDDRLHLSLMHNLTWLSEEDAKELMRKLIRILEHVSQNPECTHEEAGAAAMSKDERQMVVNDWNNTEEPFNRDQCLHHSIEETAAKMPEKVILEYLDERVTYHELNERANRMAHMIRTQAGAQIDADPEKAFVALYMTRSVDTIVAILATLKSGCAYAPISVDNATERARQILDDVQPHVVLTNEQFVRRLEEITNAPIFAVEQVPEDFPATNLTNVMRSASDLAYILYTSGTTGKPKGCMIEHKNVQWLVHGQKPWTHGPEIKKTLFWAAYMFDISVLEIFCSLITGTTIVIASDALRADVNAVGDFLIDNEIDWAFFTPTVAKVLDHSKMHRLKRVHFGGEPSTNELLNSVRQYTNVYNITGPSETTVYTQVHKFEHGDPSTAVGKPMANCKLYILDSNLQPVPIGCPGECCIGGDGVGRGYMKRPELTSEKFIDNPFEPGTRMYKSGDLCKWGEDGIMHILGRIDTQVKIRGYRIELGEVEAALNGVNGVERAVVIDAKPKNGGNKFLAAYYVGTATPEDIVKQVADVIPKYMIPATFNKIPNIPLNFNYKLDRKALPEPSIGNDEQRDMVEPRTDDEKEMCSLWSKVLGISEIGIHDNFFGLGGNSLDAARLVALSKGQVTVRALHACANLEELVASTYGAADEASSAMHHQLVIEQREGAESLTPAVLSAAQRRLVVIDRMGSKESSSYHVPWVAEISQGANHVLIADCLKQLVQRHHILRTVYRDGPEGIPMQHILGDSEFEADHVQVGEHEDLQEIISNAVDAPFALDCQIPFRATIFSQGARRLLLLNFHHIAFDGWSLDVFLKELEALYTGKPLDPPTVQYADFAVWENSHLSGDSDDVQFWKDCLKGAEAVDLGSDVRADSCSKSEGASVKFNLPAPLSDQIRALAKELHTTVYTVTLSAFYVLMARFSGQDDLIVASPVADRPIAQTQDMIGFFVNSMALRTRYEKDWSVADFVKHVRDNVVNPAMAHAHVPFDIVVNKCMDPDASTAGQVPPHFEIQFTLDRFAGDATTGSLPLKVRNDMVEYNAAKFDLVATLCDEGESMVGDFAFRKNKFSEAYVAGLSEQYALILGEFASQPRVTPLKSLSLITDAECQKVLFDWNSTQQPRRISTLHSWFEETCASTPDAVAIEFKEETITYRALNERANRLARMIRAMAGYRMDENAKAGEESFVALYLERNIDMIVALWAVMKAGAAYVPIEPSAGATDRTVLILEDAQPVCVVANEQHVSQIQSLTQSCSVLAVESIPHQMPSTNLGEEVHRQPDDLAYMIYTSGTTGKPKGCMIEHRNVCFTAEAKHYLNSKGEAGEVKRVISYASYIFDASVWELIPAFLYGQTVVMAHDEVRKDNALLAEFILNSNLDHVFLTPAMASLVDPALFKQVKVFDTAGEAPPLDLLEQTCQFTSTRNLIGPTECAVCSHGHVFKAGDLANNVGRACPNAVGYILDENMQPLPVGAPGELYIGGAGVGRGYRNRPELNSQKFMENPFAADASARLYRSGDRMRWLPNGDLQFLGRVDRQVKIRGFRIEVGEVESAIKALPKVEQAVVVDIVHGSRKALAAYVVGEDVKVGDLPSLLTARLPAYMIPSSFTLLDEIPLTVQGKVDKRALPKPAVQVASAGASNAAPQTGLEKQLSEIYSAVLGVQVGAKDNFFHSGGDSISCLQALYKIRSAGLADLRSKDFYQAPTVSAMAALILSQQQPGRPSHESKSRVQADQCQLEGSFGTLFIQDYFFDLNLPQPNHFNQSFTLALPADHDISTAKLQDAVAKLAHQHDILRCVFEDQKHVCRSDDKVPVQVMDLRATVAQENLLSSLQASLKIEDGPVWRVVLHSGNKLWMCFHHLIIDGVSWRIIADDMKTLLTGGSLGPKTCSYKQWIEHMNLYAATHGNAQVSFWKGMTNNESQSALTANHDEAPVLMEMTLDSKRTAKLLSDAHRAYNTEINDLLLAGLARALKAVSTLDSNSITLESIGRMSNDVDLSRTVGWFTTMYPVGLRDDKDDISKLIVNTKETLRSIPDKGLGYGALVKAGELSLEGLSPVSFNYLGQFGGGADGKAAAPWSIDANAENGMDVAGSNHGSKYTLEINGAVNGVSGELVLGIRSLLGRAATQTFHDVFLQTLADVIEHTCTIESPRKTPSDYPVPGLTVDWLQKIEMNYAELGIEAIFTATGLQQAFVSHAATHDADDAYCVQMMFDMASSRDFDPVCYRQAWQHVINRFPALRCAFDWSGGSTSVMVVLQNVEAPNVEIIDLSVTGQSVEEVKAADRLYGFDLSKPCPIRIKVIAKPNGSKTILVNAHHAVLDGWSMPLFLDALNAAYGSALEGSTAVQPQVDRAFFSAQEYRFKNVSEAREYWEKMDYGSPNGLEFLMNDVFSKAENTAVLDDPWNTEIVMSSRPLQELKSTFRARGLTLNVALQFAWHKMLQMYTGDEVTVVGTVDSGRDLPINGIESSVGLFINTLPLVVEWKQGATTLSMLEAIQTRVVEMGTHSSMSLLDIMAKQQTSEPLFSTVSVFENYPEGGDDETEPHFKMCDVVEKLDVPLGIMAFEDEGQLKLRLKYNRSWLSEVGAHDILEQVSRIMQFLPANLDACHEAAGAAAVAPDQLKQMLYAWNQTEAPFDSESTVHGQFESMVEQMPEAVALEFHDEMITYAELNSRANRMALMLRTVVGSQLDAERDSLVALYLNRDVNMIVAILAVLKAGAAYVPIAPDAAIERTQMILEDAKPVAILTNQSLTDKLQSLTAAPMLQVENIPTVLPGANLPVPRAASDLAYVIYTSGTTGKPKGCMLEHRHVQYIAEAQRRSTMENEHGEQDVYRTLMFSAYVFDASVIELFCPLFNGCTVVLASQELRDDPASVADFMVEKKIQFALLTPKLAELVSPAKFSGLKRIMFGGDAPSIDLLSTASKHTECWNIIGPTECAVAFSAHLFQPGDAANNIGKPFKNAKAYVLNEQQLPVPLGAPGELYIGGASVGRGYIQRPELTAEKFVANPFEPGTRMYKTGDACRFLPNGDLAFLGRTDRQVKIRGFRVELGEIESAIQQLEGVQQAAVIDVPQGRVKGLAAYVVGAIPADIVAQLTSRLPEYMIPSSFTSIDKVPVNINGKLDRRALPEPMAGTKQSLSALVAPQTPVQKQLCDIFATVLDLEAVGVTDNFFNCGGNSISAVDLTFKISSAGIGSIRAKDLYKASTVLDIINFLGIEESVAESTRMPGSVVHASKKESQEAPSHKDRTKSVGFSVNNAAKRSPCQNIDEQDGSTDIAFTPDSKSFDILPVQDLLLDMKADTPNFNELCLAFTICLPEDHDYTVEEIEDAIEELMNNHDMLRATFNVKDRKVSCGDIGESCVAFQDMRETTVPDESLQQTFGSINVEEGPMWRAVLHSGFKLFMVFHQLIIDEVSCRIIAEEFFALLTGQSLRQEPCSFQAWVEFLHEYGEMNSIMQAPFWREMTGKPNTLLKRERDHSVVEKVALSPSDSSILAHEAGMGGNPNIGTLMLSSLARALYTVNGGEATSVSLPGLGRISSEEVDVSRTVGCFMTRFPVLLDGKGDAEKVAKKVQRLLKSIPDHGIGFGIMTQQEILEKTQPQVQFAFRDGKLWQSFDLDEDWMVQPFTSVDGEGHKHQSESSIKVLCSVHPETRAVELEVTSCLSNDKTKAFCSALEQSLADTVALLAKNGRKPSHLTRRNCTQPNDPTGEKRRSKGKSIRASRVIRSYKKSIVENQYMFFIHPGGSDAAVYQPLADRLYSHGFNPKGIDNDVLMSFRKYEMAKDLNKLAQFYVDLILPAMSKAGENAPINLLGWSLGGKIALETAAILEKLGHTNVIVFLLDAFPNLSSFGGNGEELVQDRMSEFLSTRRKSLINEMMLEQHHHVVSSESALAEAPLSASLKHAKVVAFKAGKLRDGAKAFEKNGVECYDNGLSNVARKLTMILLKDYDHNNIIDAQDEIVEVISDTATASSRRHRTG